MSQMPNFLELRNIQRTSKVKHGPEDHVRAAMKMLERSDELSQIDLEAGFEYLRLAVFDLACAVDALVDK